MSSTRQSIYQALILGSMALLLGVSIGCGKKKSGHNRVVRPKDTVHNHKWVSKMTIHDRRTYRDFLEEVARVCNLYNIVNWGSAHCKTWDSSGSIYIKTQHLKPPVDGAVTIVAYSDLTGTHHPIKIKGRFALINDSSGFELRTLGPTGTPGYNQWIRVVADRGSVFDANGHILKEFRVRLFYKGLEFAYADMSHQ